jgi:hypothetical protein
VTGWFGEPWPSVGRPAPVCADPGGRVAVPVGEVCLHCGEPVLAGDRGMMQQCVEIDRTPTAERTVTRVRPLHAECLLRMSLGGPAHLQGRCSCHGSAGPGEDPDLGLSPREAARWVWRWVQLHGEIG